MNSWGKWIDIPRISSPFTPHGPKVIALMMAKDEGDVIGEWIDYHHPSYDELYVLDGGHDNLREVVKKHPKLKMYVQDEELPKEYKPIRDGARGYLFDQIKKNHEGEQYWVWLAHPDEFYIDDPRRVVGLADKSSYTSIGVFSYEFFFHVSQVGKVDFSKGVQDRLTWYRDKLFRETRFFRGDKYGSYNPQQHGRVFPPKGTIKPWESNAKLRHYSFRTEAQMLARAKDRTESKWGFSDWYVNAIKTSKVYLNFSDAVNIHSKPLRRGCP